MDSSSSNRRSYEEREEHGLNESHNLLDERISSHRNRVSVDSPATDGPQQDFSIPPTPTFTTNYHHNSGIYDSSRYSIRSYASNHPYLHVNQDSFYNTLQENIRHSSIQSGSAWTQSRSSTPVNDHHQINYSSTWGSQTNLTKEGELPLPVKPSSMSISTRDQAEKKSPSNFGSQFDTPMGSPRLPPPPGPPAGPPSGPPAIKFSRHHEILFIANVCLAQLLSLACLAQTVSPLLIIADSLGVTHPGELAWLTAAYSMSLGTFIVPAGRLGDMFGHKKIFILGFLWLALWSFLCGFAYNWGYVALCVSRGFQGIGPALLVPNGIALIGRSFPPGDKRALVIGIFGAMGPCGFLTGAAFAGMFAEVVWWPWAFWATAIACLFITFLSFVVIPDQLAVAVAPPGQKIPTFDYYGCITGVTGLMLINFALNQAPLAGWGTPYVYFLLIIGVMFTIAFFFIEMHLAKDPLLPMRGLQPQALLTLGCIAAGWGSHGVWLYYYYMFQMHLRSLSGTHATLQLAWVGPIGIIFALSTGFLIKRFHVSRVMLAAMTMFTLGAAILCYAPVNQTYWAQTFLSVLITPGGMNLSFPAGCLLLSNAMPREHQGKAASLVSTVVNYSIASGLGFAGSIEAHINRSAPAPPSPATTLRGYRGAWELGIAFAALGVLLSLYFIWTARGQIADARAKRRGAGSAGGRGASNDAASIHGQKNIFRISQANLSRPAPGWMNRVTSQIYGVGTGK